MKKYKEIRLDKRTIRFEPITQFNLRPTVPIPDRGPLEADLEKLKARLLAPILKPEVSQEQTLLLLRAANEAASLAWFTPYPLLVFPLLFQEKITEEKSRASRQEQIRQRTQGLLQQV